MTIVKLWKLGKSRDGTPIYSFFWKCGPFLAGRGKFVAATKNTYFRLCTDNSLKLQPYVRWGIRIQLLAHLKEIDPKQFTKYIADFYPQFLPDLHFSVDTIV